jgi:SAM-dependent methyltransferase
MNAMTATLGEAAASTPRDDGLIDVRKLMAELSVEQLCRTADEYYARLDSWDFHHSKPFALIDEVPDVLIKLSSMLRGLKLLPGMSIIDFGAGTGWLSRYLTQMGLEVISMDVSKAALAIGRDLYARQPVIGDQPAPRFMVFDGRRIDLPDGSVDRILCFDAFHHVPNPREVLGELCRVLKQGGIAGFCEPGPNHSKSPASQYEMKNYRVVENDVILEEIWEDAQEFGFTKLDIIVNSYAPMMLNYQQHQEFLAGGGPTGPYVEAMRQINHDLRMFFLQKGEPGLPDSRQRAGLSAHLDVRLDSTTVTASREGSPWRRPKPQLFKVHATICNNGQSIWLQHSARIGAVNFGCHLYDTEGNLLQLGYVHAPLISEKQRPIMPGETLSLDVEIPAPRKGSYILEFDMVSEAVCWFAMHGHCKPVRVRIEAV